MKVYLAYVWEYMETAHLIGVYSRYDIAQQHAKEAANRMDAIERSIFTDEELSSMGLQPAAWMTQEQEVLEA